jgi:hypothetical protein
MDKTGESREKTGLFGAKYTEHRNDSGDIVGESREKSGLFGAKYTEHRNDSGDIVGESREKSGLFGAKYTEHRNDSGDIVGESREKSGLFGAKYTEHRNDSGDIVGESRKKTGWFGDKYTEHTGHASNSGRSASYSQTASNSGGEDYGLFILAAGIAALIFVLWLIFFVAIPLVVINMALIALLGGVIRKNWSKALFPISILGAIIVVADYNRGWVSSGLVREVAFFSGWIKPMLYANLLAGLIAAYFVIRHVLNTRTPPPVGTSELSQRNLIVIGCLLAVGATTIGVQMYADTHAHHPDVVTTDSQIYSSPTRSRVAAGAGSSTQLRGSQPSVAPPSMSASTDTAGKTTSKIMASPQIRGENEPCSKNSECTVGFNCEGGICQKPVLAEMPSLSQPVSRTALENKSVTKAAFGAQGDRCTENFECGGGLKCEAGVCMARSKVTEATARVDAQSKSPSRSSTDSEGEAWKAAVKANKVTGYEAFLKEYPSGRYASAARVRLAGLQTEATPRPGLAVVPGPVPPVSAAETARPVEGYSKKTGNNARYVDTNGCLREANGSFVIGFRSDCK